MDLNKWPRVYEAGKTMNQDRLGQDLGVHGSRLFAIGGVCQDGDPQTIEMLDLDNEDAGWTYVPARLPQTLGLYG